MDQNKQKKRIIGSLVWKLLERGGTQGVQFIVTIVLARLLLPEDYGILTLIAIFISISNVFIQSSFNTALIQKKNSDDMDFSSVFYLSLFVAALLYVILFLVAPIISNFYGKPLLVSVLRVFSLGLFFGAVTSIQNAYIAKNMLFKSLFFSSLGATLVSGAVGIFLAYKGFGVWALVGQQLSNQLTTTIILWIAVKWRPKKLLSFERLRTLFSFGWKMLVSSLIERLDYDLRGLIIGKIYNTGTLGYYNRGKQFPEFIVTNVDGSIQSVLFPALSAEQDDVLRVKEMVRRSIVTCCFLIFPSMIGLAAAAETVVKVLLTDKWLPCVPFLQIFCFTFAIWPIHTSNLQAINALGRSDIFLKLEIIKKLISLLILAITIFLGVYAIAWGVLISGVISAFINTFPNRKLLNYRLKEQIKDIFPSFLLSLLMGAVIYCVKFIGLSAIITLIVQVVLGILLYFLGAKLFKLECLTYLLVSVREIIRNRSKKEANI